MDKPKRIEQINEKTLAHVNGKNSLLNQSWAVAYEKILKNRDLDELLPLAEVQKVLLAHNILWNESEYITFRLSIISAIADYPEKLRRGSAPGLHAHAMRYIRERSNTYVLGEHFEHVVDALLNAIQTHIINLSEVSAYEYEPAYIKKLLFGRLTTVEMNELLLLIAQRIFDFTDIPLDQQSSFRILQSLDSAVLDSFQENLNALINSENLHASIAFKMIAIDPELLLSLPGLKEAQLVQLVGAVLEARGTQILTTMDALELKLEDLQKLEVGTVDMLALFGEASFTSGFNKYYACLILMIVALAAGIGMNLLLGNAFLAAAPCIVSIVPIIILTLKQQGNQQRAHNQKRALSDFLVEWNYQEQETHKLDVAIQQEQEFLQTVEELVYDLYKYDREKALDVLNILQIQLAEEARLERLSVSNDSVQVVAPDTSNRITGRKS
jgi:hypothetical protein